MPRVQWDTAGARVFETGVDRGMLYVPPYPGVAWNGLSRVTESPTGGVAAEYFIDAQKYLGVASLEEYAATIEAYSSPQEFAPCAGFIRLSPGLFAGDQPRKLFGFSYRTLVGDDVQGTSAGYKIHLIYNVLAKTGDFTHESVGDTANVRPYSWTITAVPEAVALFKPLSHFVADSRKILAEALADLEDILYGTDITDPRFPTVQELITLVGA